MKVRLDVRSVTFTGLFVLGVLYSIYFARAILLPIVLAALLALLLAPVVRALRRFHVPAFLAAALVVFTLVGAVAWAAYTLRRPAARFVASAPEQVEEIGGRLRDLLEPVEQVSEAASRVGQIAQMRGETAPRDTVTVQQASGAQLVLSQTREVVAGAVVMVILLFFLLAQGDLFLRKLVRVMPDVSAKKRAVRMARHMQRQISTYLLTVTMINAALGLAIGTAMFLLGMPNPVLWGLMGAVLNFIPYLGAIVGILVVTLVALPHHDTLAGLLAVPLTYMVLTATEGTIITPTVLGRNLRLNPVAIFVGLMFWGWLWGVPGALLAVPILVSFKVVCEHYEPLGPVGEFLGR